MKNSKLQTVLLGAALGVGLLSLQNTSTAYADDDDRLGLVLPPSSCALGKDYNAWSITWWQWAASLPATHHPLFDTADVSAGQRGDVWFLGGKFCAQNLAGCTGIDVRTNTIPQGKALFFPIVVDECSAAEGLGTDYMTFRDCAHGVMDQAANIECDIDGATVPGLNQPGSPLRLLSPLFYYTLASHANIWAATGETVGNPPVPVPNGATTPAVSDGYWIFLEPLNPGKHVLHFHGEFPAYGIIEDITYYLTVSR